jgi:hypothetical protein
MMVNGGFHPTEKIMTRLREVERNKTIAFLCIQSLDQASETLRMKIVEWLDKQNW